jgi:hypothetical protein
MLSGLFPLIKKTGEIMLHKILVLVIAFTSINAFAAQRKVANTSPTGGTAAVTTTFPDCDAKIKQVVKANLGDSAKSISLVSSQITNTASEGMGSNTYITATFTVVTGNAANPTTGNANVVETDGGCFVSSLNFTHADWPVSAPPSP